MTRVFTHFTDFQTVLIGVAAVLLAMCLNATVLGAQEREESQKFYYSVGSAAIDSSYMSNAATIAQLRVLLENTGTANLKYVVIESGSSPDGSEAVNNRLAVQRGQALARFLEASIPEGILKGRTTVKYGGEDWQGLRRLVEADSSIDSGLRTRILGIIDSNVPVNTKKARMSALPEYRQIVDKYYPELRYAYLYLAYIIPPPTVPMLGTDIEIEDVPFPAIPDFEPLDETLPEFSFMEMPMIEVKKPVLAVATNLLYDLAITPNVSLELPLGQRWSMYGEYTFPWWVTRDNNRAWQILKLDLGTRYWMSPRNSAQDVLTGHFLGLDLSGGYYDIEPDNKGWQGEFILAGLEYGYAWRLGKKGNWRLDLSAGAGWMGTEYRYYEGTEDSAHLLYKKTGRYYWFGPVKAGISIKYLFNRTITRRATR